MVQQESVVKPLMEQIFLILHFKEEDLQLEELYSIHILC
jgi:hypothetical protein